MSTASNALARRARRSCEDDIRERVASRLHRRSGEGGGSVRSSRGHPRRKVRVMNETKKLRKLSPNRETLMPSNADHLDDVNGARGRRRSASTSVAAYRGRRSRTAARAFAELAAARALHERAAWLYLARTTAGSEPRSTRCRPKRSRRATAARCKRPRAPRRPPAPCSSARRSAARITRACRTSRSAASCATRRSPRARAASRRRSRAA